MFDWYLVLAPLFLLPLFMLFMFVGCSLLFTTAGDPLVTFQVRFYVDNSRLSHQFAFTVFDSASEVASAETANIQVVQGGQNGAPSLVTHRFSATLSPEAVSLSCQVTDLSDSQGALISGGDSCVYQFETSREYFVLFVAELDDDGTTPATSFDRCLPAEL